MHGAYTDGTEMRAITVELLGGANLLEAALEARVVSEGTDNKESGASDASTGGPARAQGSLAERQLNRDEYDSAEGEPW
jgi:hypothetical protein